MWTFVLLGLLILILYYSLRTDPEPLYGIYYQPGKWYWLKYSFFYLMLYLRRWGLMRSANAGYGAKAHKTLKELDGVQKLSAHPLAIDAAYFNGYNNDGYYLGAGIQRRPNGKVESLLFLRVPDLGVLEWPHSPNTETYEMKPNSYSTIGGLEFVQIVPMKRWQVKFDGELKMRNAKQTLKVKFDLMFNATSDYFDFDTDMHPNTISESIAREPWSRSFFKRLQDVHQTHHEQFGTLDGSLTVEGCGTREISLRSMRDHSYGLFRNWNDFHRYILQYFAFEDGTYIALHLVSLSGSTMSHLITGFVIEPSGQKIPIYSCDKRLFDIGEEGQPPDEYSIGITAGARNYDLRVSKVEVPVYYCGWNWEAKLHSYMCKVSANGIGGVGMCEFEYRNTTGKVSSQ